MNMMLDWNEYRKQLAAGVKQVGQLSPDTVKGYIELSSAGSKKNLLGPKIRELISLAVAVTLRCDGCITVSAMARRRRDCRGAGRRCCNQRRCCACLLNERARCRPELSERSVGGQNLTYIEYSTYLEYSIHF
jgi:hypothetical protein